MRHVLPDGRDSFWLAHRTVLHTKQALSISGMNQGTHELVATAILFPVLSLLWPEDGAFPGKMPWALVQWG